MSMSETEALLTTSNPRYGPTQPSEIAQKTHIGVFSAMFIIFNRLIGAGIFATPAVIFAFSGSIGMSLLLWVVGTLFAVPGVQVHIVWGTVSHRRVKSPVAVTHIYSIPPILPLLDESTQCTSAWSAGNSLVFGEHILKAIFGCEPSPKALKSISFGCITFVILLHGTALKLGLRPQNLLGIFKLLTISIVVVIGYVALRDGILADSGAPERRWRGRQNFRNIWQGTGESKVAICTALYSIIWSFCGFSNVNYVLLEVRDPARTLQIAGPLAVIVVAVLYVLTDAAYSAGTSKAELVGSRRLVVSLLVRNIWGEDFERWVDCGVALSALGNVLAVAFSQGRVNQELGREDALPFGSFITYPLSVINAIISFGLIYLYLSPSSHSIPHRQHWQHQSVYTLLCAVFFGLASTFLIVIPLMKPPPSTEPYESLPYWTHAAGGWYAFALGAIWWSVMKRTCNSI
ncbi:High-affinity methionine permease [Leucoagaricus sp. SymC.cos]|nr:High-affinity methionine permease [Leucoagaricus sp. SymC.cos]